MQPLYLADGKMWGALCGRIRAQLGLVAELRAMCREGERQRGHVGAMLLVEDTLQEVCDTLNRSGDGNASIYHFKTLQDLLSLDREAFEGVWSARLLAMRNVDEKSVTVALVHAVTGGGLRVYCDVFTVA
jgi:hypothetical protein